MHFRGWVPTVAGRLSFRVVGYTSQPTTALSANVSDEETRYLISFQSRNLIDSPFRLIPKLYGLRGDFVFACVATASNQTDSDEPLAGNLLIFINDGRWKDETRFHAKNAQKVLRDFDNKKRATLHEYFHDQHLSITSKLSEHASVVAPFELSRRGIASIHVADVKNGMTLSPSGADKERGGSGKLNSRDKWISCFVGA